MPNPTLLPDKDAYIEGVSFATTNYGTNPEWYYNVIYISGAKSLVYRQLATWTIPSEIASAEINKALLTWTATPNPSSGVACSIYRVTQAWTEAGVTWNKYNGVTNWAAAGGDYAEWATALDFTSSTASCRMEIDVTVQVKAAIDSYSRLFDILIRLDGESPGASKGDTGNSKEGTLVISRPYLIIVRPPFGMPIEV